MADLHHRADVLLGRLVHLRVRVDPVQEQNSSGQNIRQCDERGENDHQRIQNRCVPQRQLLRLNCRHRLRRHLAEHHDEQRDDRRSHRHRGAPAKAVRHDARHRRGREIHDIISDQNRRQHLVLLVLYEIQREPCPAVPVVGQTPQPQAAHTHHGRLRGREKGRKINQNNQNYQLQANLGVQKIHTPYFPDKISQDYSCLL